MQTIQSPEAATTAHPQLTRVAYTMAEFGAMFGKSETWAYRQKYAGKIAVIQGLGHDLIPRSEIERLLGAGTNEPKKHSRRGLKPKQQA